MLIKLICNVCLIKDNTCPNGVQRVQSDHSLMIFQIIDRLRIFGARIRSAL